jgi:hypothetical protein
MLISLKSGKPIKELKVGHAVSFLPSAANARLVYLAAEGQLQTLDPKRGTMTAAAWAQDMPRGLQLHRLLAISPNDSLLAEVSVAGQPEHALFQLRLKDGQVSGSPVAAEPIQDRATFFAAFRVPRCKSADRDCLVGKQSGDRSYLLKESVAEADEPKLVRDLSALGCRRLFAASWASADAAYVLGSCRDDQLL